MEAGRDVFELLAREECRVREVRYVVDHEDQAEREEESPEYYSVLLMDM